MKQQNYKHVVNQHTLENFERASNYLDLDQETVLEKPVRDPRTNKERDLRKLAKRDRWDD